MKKELTIACLFVLLLAACSKNKAEQQGKEGAALAVGDSFELRLDSVGLGEVQQYHCDVIDIDAFTATKELVQAFHDRGIKVIAYVSVGTLENYRPDSTLLPKEVVGEVYPDWPDERFLNLREIDKLKAFMLARLDMIRDKGFDGIEPDNIDSYGEETGFDLTLEDSRKFCEWLIEEAHKRGLSIGQKNTEELVSSLKDKFDWALTEDLFDRHGTEAFKAYISLGKPVFCAEYTDRMNPAEFAEAVCGPARQLNYYVFLKHRDLTQWTYDCH